MSITAMKQMLEALEFFSDTAICAADTEVASKAITAGRQAIEQQEKQEPVAWREFDGEGGYYYLTYDMNEDHRDKFIKRNGEHYASWVEPLYTNPQPQQERRESLPVCEYCEKERPVIHAPQREWVGLTYEERARIWNAPENFERAMNFAVAIEAKLKEKNT